MAVFIAVSKPDSTNREYVTKMNSAW